MCARKKRVLDGFRAAPAAPYTVVRVSEGSMKKIYIVPIVCVALIAIHLLTDYQIDQYIIALALIGLIPWAPTWLESVKYGDFEANFRKVEAELAATKVEVEVLKNRYSELESDYLAECEKFDPDASAQALNKLASNLKGKAKGLSSLDFLFQELNLNSPQYLAFGAACAMQVRPAFHALNSVVNVLTEVAKKPDINRYRLKTVYRLLMAIDEVVRLNTKNQDVELVSKEQSESIKRMAKFIIKNPRCKDDDTAELASKIVEKL